MLQKRQSYLPQSGGILIHLNNVFLVSILYKINTHFFM